MKPATKMYVLIGLIILAAALFFVVLDDEDTKSPQPAQITAPK